MSAKAKTEAQAKLRAKLPEQRQVVRSSGTYTVRDCVEEWIAHGLDGRSDKTRQTYREAVAPLLAILGFRTLRDLTAADVRRALASIAKTRSTRSVQIAHNTRRRRIDDWRHHDERLIGTVLDQEAKRAHVTARFPTHAQEAFLEGHVYAFEQLGGVPRVHVRYDNLKSAVSRVLIGRNRQESERWIAFRSHFGFDAFYCQPGAEGAHEKGGVEGDGGRFRRNHCVPMPVVDSIHQLNDLLAAADAKDDHRRIANRSNTVGHDYLVEKPLLRPLPAAEFPTWLTLEPRVDRYARITVRQCQYSVPAKLIGRRVRVRVGATTLTVFDARVEVATHERITIRGEQSLNLDHYLEVLQRKPGAMPGATAPAQAHRRHVHPGARGVLGGCPTPAR